MKGASEKIRDTVAGRRVKMHVFEPSNRVVWTVVGAGQEYWADPDLEFCSCAGYYFSRLHGREGCYHLESLRIAVRQKRHETVRFSDDEYCDFVSSLAAQL